MALAMRPLGAIIFGIRADHLGRRLPLMINVVFYAIVSVLSGLAPSYQVFLLLRMLLTIGSISAVSVLTVIIGFALTPGGEPAGPEKILKLLLDKPRQPFSVAQTRGLHAEGLEVILDNLIDRASGGIPRFVGSASIVVIDLKRNWGDDLSIVAPSAALKGPPYVTLG